MYRSKKKFNKLYVKDPKTLREAIQAMDSARADFIAVVDKKMKLKGVITHGDFRRAILAGQILDEDVSASLQTKPVTLTKGNAELIRD